MLAKRKIINERVEKLIKGFDRYLSLSALSVASKKSYGQVIKTLSVKGEVHKWGKEDIEDNVCLNMKLQPASRKNYIWAIRFYFGYLLDCGIRTDNPSKLVKIPRVQNSAPKYFKEGEIQNIFNSIKGYRNNLIIHLLFYCGLRATEMLSLCKNDIDIENRIITVRHGKGDKFREVPFPPLLLPILDKYLKKYNIKDHLFYSIKDKDKPQTYESIRHIFYNLSKKLGIRITCHRFRHSFCTYLFNMGVDSDTLQSFMGHSGFNMTKKYLYVMGTTRRKKYDDAGLDTIILNHSGGKKE